MLLPVKLYYVKHVGGARTVDSAQLMLVCLEFLANPCRMNIRQ